MLGATRNRAIVVKCSATSVPQDRAMYAAAKLQPEWIS